MTTMTRLARLYYPDVGERQAQRRIRDDLLFETSRFKSLKTILMRMGWRKGKNLNRMQLKVIYARLGIP